MALTYVLAQQILDALTYEAAILADIAGQGVDITGYDDFSVVKALANEQGRARNLLAQLRAQVVGLVDPVTAPLAGDDWIDIHFGGFFNEPRIGTLPAIGTLVVSVASGLGPFTYSAGDLLVEDLTTGAYFASSNTAPQVVTSSATATIAFTAQTAGAASNPLGGDLFKLVSAAGSSGLGVTVATWTKTTAGRDKETSIAYIARCLAKWSTLGAGWTRPSFDYLIPLFAPTVTGWYVDDSNPFGPGTVGVWLRDATGPASDPEVALVAAGLGSVSVRPLGSGGVTVQKAIGVALTVTAVLGTDGSNSTLVTDAAKALGVLVGVIIGPAVVRYDLLGPILRGAALGTTKIPASPAGGVDLLVLNLPGFGGVVDIAALSTSPDLGMFGLVLSAGQVLTLTTAISTVSA